ncbi:DUF2478 domain-containing protein [Sagittula salina]|uniref:DUF2478 domain-containing protein n=1 Tax=Sagittula salina TaxID=2820268 RepID=A0A940MTT2_9RHOB|nr:DUF2478 domain-containing protein [Sagittula salina]
MLGFVSFEERGAGDVVLASVAEILQGRGLNLAGAVQVNSEREGAHRCDMDLHVLSGRDVIRISQRLGAFARGCRLDPAGLEQAVGLVTAALENGPDLLVANKFGKQEIDGRGFRPVIAEALGRDIPVLIAVKTGNVAAFLEFAGEFAEELSPERDAILSWVMAQLPEDHPRAVQSTYQ